MSYWKLLTSPGTALHSIETTSLSCNALSQSSVETQVDKFHLVCFNFEIRTVKPAAVMNPVKGPRNGSLFSCISGLRYLGLGSRVTRSIFKFPDTYYVVTKVTLSKDQEHGRVWGVLVWRGIRHTKVERIGAPLKKEWSLVGVPDYSKLYGNEEEMTTKMDDLLSTYGEERIEWTPEEKLAHLGKD